MTKTFPIAAALLAGATLMSAQKIDVKTGLWEVTNTAETSGMPPVDLSKLTPEMRARVEAMMKAQQAKGAQAHTHKECVTQEKLDKDLFKADNENSSCKRSVVSGGATNLHVKIECSGERKMTGEGEFTATSRESAEGWFKIVAAEGANSMTINAKVSAKWLGPACGDVK